MGASRLVLVHPHENSQWVVDNPNCYVDMTQAGDLQRKILEVERGDRDLASDVAQNLERFTRNFEWDAVRAAYLDMFRVAAAG